MTPPWTPPPAPAAPPPAQAGPPSGASWAAAPAGAAMVGEHMIRRDKGLDKDYASGEPSPRGFLVSPPMAVLWATAPVQVGEMQQCATQGSSCCDHPCCSPPAAGQRAQRCAPSTLLWAAARRPARGTSSGRAAGRRRGCTAAGGRQVAPAPETGRPPGVRSRGG